MKKLVTGILIGSALTMSVTAFADSIKQYILTEVSYPLVVNGKEYKDAAAPILNYEGSTYVPLAKLGDITGVNYKWNDEAKRVEIVTAAGGTATGSGHSAHDLSPDAAGQVTGGTPSGGTLTPETQVVEPKGLVQESGETVFYAYDKDDRYKGRFTDSDNADLTIALIEKQPIPPKLSEGWLPVDVFAKIYNAEIEYKNQDLVIKTPSTFVTQQEFLRVKLPVEWETQKDGEATINGIQIKQFNNGIYFKIADLQKAGLIK